MEYGGATGRGVSPEVKESNGGWSGSPLGFSVFAQLKVVPITPATQTRRNKDQG